MSEQADQPRSTLSADVFARYCRTQNLSTLYVRQSRNRSVLIIPDMRNRRVRYRYRDKGELQVPGGS
jgi:hypothetical protein